MRRIMPGLLVDTLTSAVTLSTGTYFHEVDLISWRAAKSVGYLGGLAEELRTPAGPSCVSGPWLRSRRSERDRCATSCRVHRGGARP